MFCLFSFVSLLPPFWLFFPQAPPLLPSLYLFMFFKPLSDSLLFSIFTLFLDKLTHSYGLNPHTEFSQIHSPKLELELTAKHFSTCPGSILPCTSSHPDFLLFKPLLLKYPTAPSISDLEMVLSQEGSMARWKIHGPYRQAGFIFFLDHVCLWITSLHPRSPYLDNETRATRFV